MATRRIGLAVLITITLSSALLGGGAPSAAAAGPAPVPVSITAGPAVSQPGWDGLGSAIPADDPSAVHHNPSIAVGPEHVVQVMSGSIRVWTREGVSKLGPTSIKAARFFNLPARFRVGDAMVLFDSVHGRWVATETSWACDGDGNGSSNDPKSFADVIVSQTADPLGTWDLRRYQIVNAAFDGSSIGTSSDKLAISATVVQFSGPGTPYCFPNPGQTVASKLYVTDWTDVLARGGQDGQVMTTEMTWGARARFARQMPATSAALHIVNPGVGAAASPSYAQLSGSAVANSVQMKGPWLLPVAGFVEPPHPTQPGGQPVVTEDMDARLTDVIWQDSRLTFASTNGCVPSGDSTLRACVRITQVRTSETQAAPPPVLQDFLIGGNGVHNYLAGLGQAADGTLYAAWNQSSTSPTGYVTPVAAYRRLGDPANRITGIEILHASGGSPTFSGHWGDFASLAPDPQVPNAVWQGNMYVGAGGGATTHITQLRTDGSTYVPITPLRVLDTRPGIAIGLSGTFGHGTARSWVVRGFGAGAIPANAIAVTGNLTVTNQTAGGYVSVTPGPNNNPSSSTVNFPVGDNRANNLTIPLGANGKVSAVYRATAGKTTNLIFDVTGYFVAGSSQNEYKTITPVRALDSRPGINIGLSGPFQKDVPRKLSIGPAHVPAEAVAITGNLTAVGQTGAGYLAITPASNPNPATSNLNFPLGDTRANGFVARLDAEDDIWIVYKTTAPGARSTNVVLDVTGYFVNDPAGMQYFPLTPGRIMDTRNVPLSGLTGYFSTDVPRKLVVGGHWGVPSSAGAITGNLTVVSQTAAGYVAVTLTNNPSPTTSNLNFPFGDARANGITVPVSGTSDIWIVYKTTLAGKRTHLILDVSGYFD
jgi:hypothetical protein